MFYVLDEVGNALKWSTFKLLRFTKIYTLARTSLQLHEIKVSIIKQALVRLTFFELPVVFEDFFLNIDTKMYCI